jgi:hypothetical protein
MNAPAPASRRVVDDSRRPGKLGAQASRGKAHKVVSCEIAVADAADVVVVDDAIDHLRIRLRRRTRGIAAGKVDDGLQPVHADMLAYPCPLEGHADLAPSGPLCLSSGSR